MTPFRKRTVFVALSLAATFLLPTALAHWSSPQVQNVTPTHAHFVAGGSSTITGLFVQRLCQGQTTGDLYWSHEDGTCPQPPTTFEPTVAFMPPFRGLDLGTGDCEDFTVDPLNYVVFTPHSGSLPSYQYPDNIFVDNGDVDNYYMSGSDMTHPHAAGTGGGTFGSIGNGRASGLGQSPAANRLIWYDDYDPFTDDQGFLGVIGGNDRYDSTSTYFLASGTPYTTTRLSRFEERPISGDITDHDYETGVGAACFTYAIDNGPNGIGCDGANVACYPGSGFATAPRPLDNAPFPNAGGCQEDVDPFAPGQQPAFDGGCGGAGRPAARVFCGAGLDLNDPAHPVGTASWTLTPEGPGFGPSPIGNDAVYDTTATSNALPFANCPGNPRGKAVTGTLVGSGAAILGHVGKGVKLHHIGWPVEDTTLGGWAKIGYTLCNDVARTGCTNVPVDSADLLGFPCAGDIPAPSGCHGHVGARLQDCVYDPTDPVQAANRRPNPGSLGPLGTIDTPDFYGQAALWGTRIQKPWPCWPERLYWNPGANAWTPASEPGSYNGGVWSGDDAPATARGVETIFAFVNTADLGLLRGFTLCDEGSLAWTAPFPTGPGPFCSQSAGAPTLPTPEPGTWTAGWAAVFL